MPGKSRVLLALGSRVDRDHSGISIPTWWKGGEGMDAPMARNW